MSDSTKTHAIIGKRGQGKTTLAKRLLYQHLNNNALVFVLDYIGEYGGQVFTDRRALDLSARVPFCYRGSDPHYFADTVWQAGKSGRPVLAVLDEVDVYGKNCFPLAFLYRYGRHRNISIVAVARRFFDLPIYIRDLSAVFHVFKITGQRDLDALAKMKNKPTSDLIRTLSPHHFVSIDL